MRSATESVGVAIALHEIAPALGRERRIDIEFKQQFGIAGL
jgi:hypothetical protein